MSRRKPDRRTLEAQLSDAIAARNAVEAGIEDVELLHHLGQAYGCFAPRKLDRANALYEQALQLIWRHEGEASVRAMPILASWLDCARARRSPLGDAEQAMLDRSIQAMRRRAEALLRDVEPRILSGDPESRPLYPVAYTLLYVMGEEQRALRLLHTTTPGLPLAAAQPTLTPLQSEWRVASFSAERGFGRVRSDDTGEEARFDVEVWWPGDPVVCRAMQDSEQRRHLLLPRVGEPVDVEWAISRRGDRVPSAVRRLEQAVEVGVRLPFRAWFARLAAQVPALGGWNDARWQDFDVLDLSEAIDSDESHPPEAHMAVLATVRESIADAPAGDLAWLSLDEAPGAIAVEATWGDGQVFLLLPDTLVQRLVAQGLIVPVAAE